MTSTMKKVLVLASACSGLFLFGAGYRSLAAGGDNGQGSGNGGTSNRMLLAHVQDVVESGQSIFRFDTFGDEAFWGGVLGLHQAIEGATFGGIGPGVSPRTALDVGLKVDADALAPNVLEQVKHGKVNLDDPAVTLALLRQNAVLGVKGIFSGSALTSMGITCALCHSTVDNSVAFGIGHRLDGFANRDLNVGAIVALAPNLQPVATLLGTDVATVKAVLNSWGPGKFDAELFLDGKAFNPQQMTDGVVTGTNVSGATLLPNAFGLAGFNQHTWTGAWGTVPYWNAFVAALEMHGKGTFFDPRLDNAAKFPIAAANGFGHIFTDPDNDQITSKLPALQIYQLVLPVPEPTAGADFDAAAAARGDELFGGKAKCGHCHVEPLWTEPGWNLHPPADIGIDAFQADRAPDNQYKTMNLAGIFIRERGLFMKPENKGRYYHDGRFATLLDVVNHYNQFFSLGLSSQEKSDIVEYLKSLGGGVAGMQKPATTMSAPGAPTPESSPGLAQNYPNPFNPSTTITYDLPEASSSAAIEIYTATGALVRKLVDREPQSAGHHMVTWDGKDDKGIQMATGIYFYRLYASGRLMESKKMTLLK